MASVLASTSTIIIFFSSLLFVHHALAQNCGCASDQCCSKWGYCGTTDAYCGYGCQEGPCYPKPCGCPSGECCSKWGYCGTGADYCGDGCQEGPCHCRCSDGECCSKWGYCGTTDAYCGEGCQKGPCYSSPPSGGSSGSGTSVADVVTQSFFDGIINQASRGCAGKSFYTRAAFLDAAKSYPSFGSKVEIAAFFAHVTRETGHFCYIDEINGASRDYCDKSSTKWPCVKGEHYYGRGPLQLTWNYNYGAAGKALGLDLLNAPDTVGRDAKVAFKASMWYWMTYVHPKITSGKGFGATIRAINGGECNGGNTVAVNQRIKYYKSYCSQLNVSPGGTCLARSCKKYYT